MSGVRDKLLADFDKYINAMRERGKKPTALYVTKKQWNQMGLGLFFQKNDDESPHYKNIPVVIHG